MHEAVRGAESKRRAESKRGAVRKAVSKREAESKRKAESKRGAESKRKAVSKRGAVRGAVRGAARIDFSKIKWGTFTAMFAAYRRRHPHTRIVNLDQFSRLILAHPKRFDLKAKRRALFYRNIILKGKGKKGSQPKKAL